MSRKTSDKVGVCRFCGQSQIVSGSGDMTAEQLTESATLSCGCELARKYQATSERTTVAKRRVDELFGDELSDFAQSEDIRDYMKQGIDLINKGGMKKITMSINECLKCSIALMAEEKIKVIREIKYIKEYKQ